jgi:hypothetical protein
MLEVMRGQLGNDNVGLNIEIDNMEQAIVDSHGYYKLIEVPYP